MSEPLDSRLKKFIKNCGKKEDRAQYKKLFKDFVKKQSGKEHNKAGAFIGLGAGLIEGGALGVAIAGTGFGVPLVVAGAGVGLAGYGAYRTYKACKASLKGSKKADSKDSRKSSD